MATNEELEADLFSFFHNLKDKCEYLYSQIKDEEKIVSEESAFDREVFWGNITTIFACLSKETTKISLAFSKKPFPSKKNTESLSTDLEKSLVWLTSLFFSFPLSEGRTLKSHLQKAVLKILGCVINLVVALRELITSEGDAKRLQWTGGVWEAADFILLKDNKLCVVKDLESVSELVNDALGEIEEAGESDGAVDLFGDCENVDDNSNSWSDNDRLVVKSVEGLVKTMKSLLKKTHTSVCSNGDPKSLEGIACLDDLANIVSSVSESVDDLVCCIYAPVNYIAVINNGKKLSEHIGNILKFLGDTHFTNNTDSKWLDFLSKANDHNMMKLTEAITLSQLQNL